jgi:hypothetical protein
MAPQHIAHRREREAQAIRNARPTEALRLQRDDAQLEPRHRLVGRAIWPRGRVTQRGQLAGLIPRHPLPHGPLADVKRRRGLGATPPVIKHELDETHSPR